MQILPLHNELTASLQMQAEQCATVLQGRQQQVRLQVTWVWPSDTPWRLIETHVRSGRTVLRHLFGFANEHQLVRYLRERVSWRRRDRALLSTRLPMDLGGLRPEEFAEEARQSDPHLFERVCALNPKREQLWRSVCTTQPAVQRDLLAARSHAPAQLRQ